MTIGSVSLTSSSQANLLALQNTENLLNQTQEALATGKKINSPADNAPAFTAAQGFLQQASNLANAKNNVSTALATVTSTTSSIGSVSQVVQQLQGITTQAQNTTDPNVRAQLATQYNALLPQLDQLVNDSSFNGTNLLNGSSNLTVSFDGTNTSGLTIPGVNVTASGLNITTAASGFATTADINASSAQLSAAQSTLTTDAASFGSNATLIQTNQDFTSNLINNLQSASNNLTVADTNEEGANLLALQAQNQLGIVSLNISGQAAQGILQLFKE